MGLKSESMQLIRLINWFTNVWRLVELKWYDVALKKNTLKKLSYSRVKNDEYKRPILEEERDQHYEDMFFLLVYDHLLYEFLQKQKIAFLL